MFETTHISEAGDRALVVEVGDTIDPETNDRVRSLMLAVEGMDVPGISDLVPSYRSLLIAYDPTLTDHDKLVNIVTLADANLDAAQIDSPRVVTLPTLYGGERGPDIDYVAENAGISAAEVIDLHSCVDYRVYMIGFAPGFPYLGGLSEKLATPRLSTPRVRIPAGSVGIAEAQTGVYPSASPGGWQLIGRTPVPLFEPDRKPPSLVVAGDYIKFSAIGTEAEYKAIQAAVAAGEYQPQVAPAAPDAPDAATGAAPDQAPDRAGGDA
jgi:inhibitor of KinA